MLETEGFALPFRAGDPRLAMLTRCCVKGGMLAILGERGFGKTQAVAAATLMATMWHGRTAEYWRVADLIGDFRQKCYRQGESEHKWFERKGRVDVVVIDELQERSDTANEDVFLTRLIDHRYAHPQVATVLISNLRPEAFYEAIGRSATSRLTEDGAVLQFDMVNYRQPEAQASPAAGRNRR